MTISPKNIFSLPLHPYYSHTIIFILNRCLHKVVIVTSDAAGFPASNIVDGKISRTSKWEAANDKAPHIVEIDLKKYFNITELRIHSGIMDSEKKTNEMTQAASLEK